MPRQILQSIYEGQVPQEEAKQGTEDLGIHLPQVGDKHPFNRYCPYAVEPPIIPGECRSCATLTNVHDDGCEMVAIKDRIGLCAFCGEVTHAYAECPERYPNRAPKRVMGRTTDARELARDIVQDRNAIRPPVYYGVCSFCGSAGHGHEECPGLKEAVQEQAAQLAQIQIARYEAARIAPPWGRDEGPSGAEDHQRSPQRARAISRMGGGPGPGGGVTMTPTVTRVVSVDTRKTGGEPGRTEVTEVAKARRMIQTREGETDPLRAPEGGTALEATQGHQAPKDPGDPQDQPDEKGTWDRPQESET